MRRLLPIVLVVGALLAPSAASAQDLCVCMRHFAHAFTVDARTRQLFRDEANRQGIVKRKRDKIRDGIYDWAREGEFDSSWCTRNRKVCRATVACLISAGTSVASSVAAGQSEKQASRQAAIACAGAAAASLAAP